MAGRTRGKKVVNGISKNQLLVDATYVPLLQSEQDNEPLIIKYSPGETADFGGHYTALRKRTPTATLEEEEPTLRMAEGALGHEMCCMYSCSVVCGGEFANF